MEKKSRNFKKWERFLKKDKDLSSDVDIELCAQLLANQEKFEKTILDVAKENFNKRSNPEYQELQYEPCSGGIESTGLTMGGYFSLEW